MSAGNLSAEPPWSTLREAASEAPEMWEEASGPTPYLYRWGNSRSTERWFTNGDRCITRRMTERVEFSLQLKWVVPTDAASRCD